MSVTIDHLTRLTGLKASQIAAIYPYGSRVYGTASYHSDTDFIVVYSGDPEKDAQQYDSHDKMLSAHTYTVESWQGHLDNHKIFAMEAHFAGRVEPRSGISREFTFSLDLPTLRKEISSKASNSWVKCKKKLEVENDYYIGIKSLFHSFRIPMFGIQIARDGKITDFMEANSLWFDELLPILGEQKTWAELKEEYQPRHNALMTEFRKYAEKV